MEGWEVIEYRAFKVKQQKTFLRGEDLIFTTEEQGFSY
jgi:hypothetical protein